MFTTELPRFLFKSRGILNLMTRAYSLVKRFGVSPTKMEGALSEWAEMSRKHGFRSTLPVTAIIVKRYPGTIRRLQAKGLEFAVHGYTHIDHAVLSLDQQMERFKKAIREFKTNAIRFEGFRAPYTRWNMATLEALKKLGIQWDSSKTILWDVDENQAPDNWNIKRDVKRNWQAYNRVLQLYKPERVSTSPVTPEFLPAGKEDKERIVEIPICLPEDEMLLDRLGLTPEEIGQVWKSVLDRSYVRGELFALQLHPERFPLCASAVEDIVGRAKKHSPGVWIASISEIAEWWKKRAETRMDLQEMGGGRYRILLDDVSQFTTVLRNVEIEKEHTSDFRVEPWYGSYQRVVEDNECSTNRNSHRTRELWLKSKSYPGVGVSNDCPDEERKFLISEGYFLGQDKNCKVFFDGEKNLKKTEIMERIEESGAPVCRLWRWPYGARSCLSITGDVDALTLIDFLMRALGR